MARASREFQVFAKPVGAICNLDCHYCYYLKKEHLYPRGESFRMSDDMLETYIIQHIEAAPEPVVRFSWHGGEPTILGLDFFRNVVAFQREHQYPHQRIINGIQTNGTLLDEEWCRFLAAEHFDVGLSLDGPQELHDRYRLTRNQEPTHTRVMRGYKLLLQHGIAPDILCVVNSCNVHYSTEVYRFFREIGTQYVSFLPLVEPEPERDGGVSQRSVPAETWGDFLCVIFDEWKTDGVGHIKVQIFEEATRTAFDQEHSLCIFREVCGDIPVVEHNGDIFSCDHYVDAEHHLGNIQETPLVELLESPTQQAFGQAKRTTLPRYCKQCDVRKMCHGGCPKNRFIQTPDGEEGLNYLCGGYKQFFTHCRPFVEQVAALWRQEDRHQDTTPAPDTATPIRPKAGRNAPCPCGSGKKYKKCCLGK